LEFTETCKSKAIAIIGGGFCGVLTAIHMLRHNNPHLHIYLINKGHALAKGIAYSPHTPGLLLNVPSNRMSALPDIPDHYTNWLKQQYTDLISHENLCSQFSTRRDYGSYLTCLWENTIKYAGANNAITVCHEYADDITGDDNLLHINLRDGTVLTANTVILATGNGQPRLPTGISKQFENSRQYFADPWNGAYLGNASGQGDTLIIGAGLTMVDTVIGLIENNCTETIHTISPNGYRLKPWKENKENYSGFSISEIMSGELSLLRLLQLFNRHRKLALRLDQSFYPMVDVLRPYSQNLWQQFSLKEKQQFIKYLKPFWEKVRHRLPDELYKKMEDLRISGKLITHKGHIVSVNEVGDKAVTTLCCDGQLHHFDFKKIINCTGPETNIERLNDVLLNNLFKKGWISPGPCGLGMNINPEDKCVITANGEQKPNLFVIGNHLKGVLWESTAVPELRLQAKKLADQLIGSMYPETVKIG